MPFPFFSHFARLKTIESVGEPVKGSGPGPSFSREAAIPSCTVWRLRFVLFRILESNVSVGCLSYLSTELGAKFPSRSSCG